MKGKTDILQLGKNENEDRLCEYCKTPIKFAGHEDGGKKRFDAGYKRYCYGAGFWLCPKCNTEY